MTDVKKDSCEVRIDSYMNDREQWLKDAFNAIENDTPYEGYEDAHYALGDFPLGIDKYDLFKIHLSTGGPGDWLEVKVDPSDGYVIGVDYHFNDWFDHAFRTVSKTSYLFEYAEYIVGPFYY